MSVIANLGFYAGFLTMIPMIMLMLKMIQTVRSVALILFVFTATALSGRWRLPQKLHRHPCQPTGK